MGDNVIPNHYREVCIPIDHSPTVYSEEPIELDKLFNITKFSQKLNFKPLGSRWLTVNEQSFFIYWAINYVEEEGLACDYFDIVFLSPTSFNESQFQENALTADINPTNLNSYGTRIASYSKIISQPHFNVVQNRISILYLTEGNDLVEVLFDKIDDDFQGKTQCDINTIHTITNQQISAFEVIGDQQVVFGTKSGNLFHLSFTSPASDESMVVTELRNQPLFQKLKFVFTSGQSAPIESITHTQLKGKNYIFTYADDKLSVWSTKGFLQSINVKKDGETNANTVYSLTSIPSSSNVIIIALLTNIGYSSSISIFACRVGKDLKLRFSFTSRLKNSSISDFALSQSSLSQSFTYNSIPSSSSSPSKRGEEKRITLWALGKNEQGDDFVKYTPIDESLLFDDYLQERNQWNELILEETYNSHHDDEIAGAVENGLIKEVQESYLSRIFLPNRFSKIVIAQSLLRFCESSNLQVDFDDALLLENYLQLSFHQLKQLVVKYMQQAQGLPDMIWPQLLSHCSTYSKELYSPISLSSFSSQPFPLFTRHKAISMIVPCDKYENIYFEYFDNNGIDDDEDCTAEMKIYKYACDLTANLRPFTMINYLDESSDGELINFNFDEVIKRLSNSLLTGDYSVDPSNPHSSEFVVYNPLLFHNLSSLFSSLSLSINDDLIHEDEDDNRSSSDRSFERVIQQLLNAFELEEIEIKQESPANYHPFIFKTSLISFTRVCEIRMTIILKIAVLLSHLLNIDQNEEHISHFFGVNAIKRADSLLRRYYLMRWLSYQSLVDDSDKNEGALLDLPLLDAYILLSRQYLLQFHSVLSLTSCLLITTFHSIYQYYYLSHSSDLIDDDNFNIIQSPSLTSSPITENLNSVCHFLLKHNQFPLLHQLANYLFHQSEAPALLHYYLGFSFIHSHQFDKSILSFERSLPICDLEKCKKMIDHCQLYSPFHTIQLTNVILSFFSAAYQINSSSDFSTLEHFLRVVFNCSLEIGDYFESLKAISLLRSNLNYYYNKLITSLIDNNKLDILSNFPINRKSFAITKKILHDRACNQPLLGSINYYSILYSLFLKQQQYHKAADVMMEYIDRLHADDNINIKEKCIILRDNYLLAITALRLTDDHLVDQYRWAVFRDNGYHFVTIVEMEKQFLLLNILEQFNRFDYYKLKNAEKKILSHLVVNNRFDMALAFGSKYQLDLSRCFRSITQLYLDNLESNSNTDIEEKLRDWLEQYDNRFTNFKYRSVVCNRIERANQPIPEWLLSYYSKNYYPFFILNTHPELIK